MNIFTAFRDIQETLANIGGAIQRIIWENDQSLIHGTVCDVDAKKQLCRLVVGLDEDDQEVKSPWVPYGQIAGTRKIHSAPSNGQQMTLFAPNGDHMQAIALPFTWSDNNPSPSESADEDIDLRGKSKRTQKDGSVKQEVDGVTREYTKQSHELTIHKDPENEQEGKNEEVSDKKPWKGNRAKALHRKKITKDGGYELTINEGDDQKEHKITVNPTDNAVEISTHKGKHKITIKKNEMKVSFGNGQHETTYSDSGIKHKSSTKVQIESPQIEHNGDLMVIGSVMATDTVQSQSGFIGNLQGISGGTGFLGGLTPPTTW